MVKIYLAVSLNEERSRKYLESLDILCRSFGFDTFLPHRDCGLYDGDLGKIPRISKRDLEEIYLCDILIGVLNGICVGAGTAWEMGYAQALGKKVIGLKTDRIKKDAIADISVIMAGCVKIVWSEKALENELRQIKSRTK